MDTVLLVEDDAFSRDGVARYLRRKGFTVCEAGDRETGRRLIETKRPSTAIIDIVIPAKPGDSARQGINEGIKLALQVKERYPHTGVIIFSAHSDRGEAIFDLVSSGTRGIAYLFKGIRPSALLQAIKDTQNGKVVLSPQDMDMGRLATALQTAVTPDERPWIERAQSQCVHLTPREWDAAQRIAAAHTLQSMAAAMNITPKTAENYTSRIYDKLGLQEMAQRAPHLRKAIILAKACMLYEIMNYEA